MTSDPFELEKLLKRFQACFPAHSPLRLRASADAWADLAEAFPSGHVERWFDAHDGDASGRLVYEGFALLSLAQSLEARESFARLRRASGLSWKAHWMLIAVAHGGRALAINDRTGALIALSPDRAKAARLASSPEAWLRRIVEAHEAGAMVWEPTLGLTNAAELHRNASQQRAQEAELSRKRNNLIGWLIGLVILWLLIRRLLG